MRNVKYPSQPKQKKPKAIQSVDVTKLFESIGDDIQSKRDKAIIAFLIDTGCRANGLATLRVDHLDLGKRQALVDEKGGKVRTVVFTRFTRDLLSEWLQVAPRTEHVFINFRTYKPLTTSGVGQLLKRIAKKAGIKGRVNTHSFRHAFAREYLRNGGDLATLSRILGHADMATTVSYYAIFAINELADLHENFSPAKDLEQSLDKED